MGVCFEKLFHLPVERKMTTRELDKIVVFSGNTTTQRRNAYISLESSDKICRT